MLVYQRKGRHDSKPCSNCICHALILSLYILMKSPATLDFLISPATLDFLIIPATLDFLIIPATLDFLISPAVAGFFILVQLQLDEY